MRKPLAAREHMVRTDPGSLSETTVARIDRRGNPSQETGSAGVIYRNRSGHWLGARHVSVLAVGSALPRAVLLAYGQECRCLAALSVLVAQDSPRERRSRPW